MIDIQSGIAYTMIAGAAYYIYRDIRGQFAPSRQNKDDEEAGHCGACGGCNPKPAEPQLIQLTSPPKRQRPEKRQ